MNTIDKKERSEAIFERLRQCFGFHFTSSLYDIFYDASKDTTEKAEKELEMQLFSLLEHMNNAFRGYDGIMKWEFSPRKSEHVIVVGEYCYLVNIWGITPILRDLLFLEGEMQVENFEWYEKENIVVFDIVYLVHRKRSKCLCRFSHTDATVRCTPPA